MDNTPAPKEETVKKDEWVERCDYWSQIATNSEPKRKRRERRKTPLVVTGYNLSVRVDKGRLIVCEGTTHYPSKPSEHIFFKGGLDVPARLVLVDGNGSISLDALDWLEEQNVDVIRLRYDGRVRIVSSASGYSADPKKVAWQKKTRASEAARLSFAIPLIREKIRETLYNLENFLPPSPSRDKAIIKCKETDLSLKRSPPTSLPKLLALEGAVAQGYFFSWRALKLNWKDTQRHPIPNEWTRFFSRSSLMSTGATPRNRNATHPVNAMLNYAYGLLESQVRISVVAEGYDPSVGIMHDRIHPDRHSFVFDKMEPLRPVADRFVLKLVEEETFSGADFQLQSNGVVRVNPDLTNDLISSIAQY